MPTLHVAEDRIVLRPAEQHARARLGHRDDVTFERRLLREVDPARRRGRALPRETLERRLVDRAPRGEDGLLGEHGGKLGGVLDEVEAPAADLREHLELRRVAAPAQRDHARRHPAVVGLLHDRAAAGDLLGVRAVGEEQQMLQVDALLRRAPRSPRAARCPCRCLRRRRRPSGSPSPMASGSFTGDIGTVQRTTVSTCSTPSRSPGPRSDAERAAASFASSSFVCPLTIAPIEPL